MSKDIRLDHHFSIEHGIIENSYGSRSRMQIIVIYHRVDLIKAKVSR